MGITGGGEIFKEDRLIVLLLKTTYLLLWHRSIKPV